MARRKKPPLFELARETRAHGARFSGGGAASVVVEPSRRAPANVHHEPEPQPRAPLPAPTMGASAAESAAGDWRRWITPGRTMRVPVGYIFLAAAALLTATLASYMFGFRRGGVARERELVALRADAAVRGPAKDPLLADQNAQRPPVAPTNTRAGGEIDAAEAASALGPLVAGTTAPNAPSSAEPASKPAASRDPLVIEDSTRVPLAAGLNYYIIDRLRPDEALAAARYLRLHGVEAAVFSTRILFPGDSSSLRLVVALKGFAPGEVSSPESKTYASRIREIGRRWRAEENGVSDFSTMYAAKYQP